MRVPFVDTKAQYEELKDSLDQVALEVLSSGAYVLGKHNKGLEQEIAELHGVKYAIAVNSGTDAQRIAMQAAGIGPGDEVITTSFTFVASVETIVQLGATPVLVDIDPLTYNIDPSKIEAAITPRTKAIVPVHLFGQLSDVVAIEEIANRHNLVVIEDAAQGIASHYKGKYTGNFGLAASFSFYVTKNLGAAGDGGMILTNDEAINEASRSLRIHGMGRERYYYDAIGYTSRMDELQAAILRVKLTKLEAWNARRNELAKIYYEELGHCNVVLPKISEGNNHTFHQFTIQTQRRDELQAFLKELGVDSMVYYPVPIHFHEPYKVYGHGPGTVPITEKLSNEVLSLPIQQHLTVDQIAHAARCVKEFCSLPVGAA